MSNCPFCNLDPPPVPTPSGPTLPSPNSRAGPPPPGLFRRAWRTTQWLFPITLLALLPKCPMCLAAYVALFTGLGISLSTARWLQLLLLVFCLTSLAYLTFRKALA